MKIKNTTFLKNVEYVLLNQNHIHMRPVIENEIIFGNNFMEQMSRFLPINVQERTLLNTQYLELLFQKNFTIFNELRVAL